MIWLCDLVDALQIVIPKESKGPNHVELQTERRSSLEAFTEVDLP
jgi:hypothetical protein